MRIPLWRREASDAVDLLCNGSSSLFILLSSSSSCVRENTEWWLAIASRTDCCWLAARAVHWATGLQVWVQTGAQTGSVAIWDSCPDISSEGRIFPLPASADVFRLADVNAGSLWLASLKCWAAALRVCQWEVLLHSITQPWVLCT